MSAAVNVSPTALAAGAAVVVGGFLIWKASSAAAGAASKAATAVADAAGAAVDAVNPTNPDNAAAKAVNAVGGAIITDTNGPGKNADGSWTLGGWVFDITHPNWENK